MRGQPNPRPRDEGGERCDNTQSTHCIFLDVASTPRREAAAWDRGRGRLCCIVLGERRSYLPTSPDTGTGVGCQDWNGIATRLAYSSCSRTKACRQNTYNVQRSKSKIYSHEIPALDRLCRRGKAWPGLTTFSIFHTCTPKVRSYSLTIEPLPSTTTTRSSPW